MERMKRLAKAWCQYNGQKGTEKQIEKTLRNGGGIHLDRMLRERGVIVD